MARAFSVNHFPAFAFSPVLKTGATVSIGAKKETIKTKAPKRKNLFELIFLKWFKK